MIEQVKNLTKQVEMLLRGGSTSVIQSTLQELHATAPNLLRSFYEKDATDFDSENLDAAMRSDYITVATKLYNKARNLTAPSQIEIRSYLKAICAWLMSIYGDEKANAISSIIKIMGKAGQEMVAFENSQDLACSCSSSAIALWKRGVSISFQKDLPSHELQEVKHYVFSAYVTCINILNKSEGFQVEQMRKAVSGAMEIVQTLSARQKFSFANLVVQVAHNLSAMPGMTDESVHYYQLAINMLDSANLLNAVGDSEEFESTTKMRRSPEFKTLQLYAYLGLTFMYMEQKQTLKAISCLNSIASTTAKAASAEGSVAGGDKGKSGHEHVQHTILFAKVKIYLMDQDKAAAESALWALIKLSTTPFETALYAVKMFVDDSDAVAAEAAEGTAEAAAVISPVANQVNNPHHQQQQQAVSTRRLGEKVDEATAISLYKYLASKYPNDPEYTTIRMSNLQSILTNTQGTHGGYDEANQKALSISNSIVCAHTKRERVLSGDHYQTITSILRQRIRWCKSMVQWDLVLAWSECLLQLLSDEKATELDSIVAIQVIQADAMIHLRKYNEAAQLSKLATEALPSTKSILMSFYAQLHAEQNERVVVENLVELLRRTNQADDLNGSVNSNVGDNLARIMLCCRITKDASMDANSTISEQKSDRTIIFLLKEWIQSYASSQGWKAAATDNTKRLMEMREDAAADPTATLLETACQLVQSFTDQYVTMPTAKSPKQQQSQSHLDRMMEVEDSTTIVKTPIVNPDDQRPASYLLNNNGEMDVDPSVELMSASTSTGAVQISSETSTKHVECGNGGGATVDEAVDVLIALTTPPAKDEDQVKASDSQTAPALPSVTTPAAAAAAAAAVENYSLLCTLEQLREDQLKPLETMLDVIHQVETTNTPIACLGATDLIDWLAKNCWNFGSLLIAQCAQPAKQLWRQQSAQLSSQPQSQELPNSGRRGEEEQTSAAKTKPTMALTSLRLLTAARFFEIAAGLYHFAVTHDFEISTATRTRAAHDDINGGADEQARCLLYGCAARLDIINDDTAVAVAGGASSSSSSSSSSAMTGASTRHERGGEEQARNLQQAQANADTAEGILRAQSDFENFQSRQLRLLALKLQFVILCEMGDTPRCQDFLADRQNDLLQMSCQELQACAARARAARSRLGSSVTHALLNYALQVNARMVFPDRASTGAIYRQLIDLSETRAQALEKVEEFEQLLHSTEPPPDDPEEEKEGEEKEDFQHLKQPHSSVAN